MNRKAYRGLLVTNAFLRTEKFTEHYAWLARAAEAQGIRLDQTDNAQRLFCVEEIPEWLEGYHFILYWDKDIPYGRRLSWYAADHKIRMYNPVDAIAACDDKFETYCRLACWNTSHPEQAVRLLPTMMAPMTYAGVGYTSLDFLGTVEEKLGYPMVVKECSGSFGQQVYRAADRQELEDLTCRLAGKPFLYQKYASWSSGRDVRLQVVGDRVVAGIERYSENGDFRANITNGGKMRPYLASAGEQMIAVRAAKALGADLAGVDLLFGQEGVQADIICEINSNAHFKNIYTCTGIDVAEEIMRYIFCDLSGDRL